MMDIKPWITYYLKAKTKYKLHSTWAYEVMDKLLNTTHEYYDFEQLAKIRKELRKSKETVEFIELGAGSRKLNQATTRSVNHICKYGISSDYQCKVLFNIANWYGGTHIVEIGTSLGLSTCYLATARRKAKVVSFDGSKDLQVIAQKNATKLNLKHVSFIEGNFEDTLPSYFANCKKIDLLYLDGNHRKEATLRYFNWALPVLSNKAVVVVDDIHWSSGMYEAWNELISRKEIKASFETPYFGLLFLDNEIPKHNITYLPYWAKPWQIGLWP